MISALDAAFHDHERLLVITDRPSGLRAVIAVHSTQLGPAMGGIRRRAYASIEGATVDALRLSEAMTAKNALAGLPVGGGKAVIVDGAATADPRQLRAFAVALDGLGGGYIGAEDIGTTPADMDLLAEHTRFVAGRSRDAGGSGDPSPCTARTVLAAMLAALQRDPGDPSALAGVRVGVLGVGKVGELLAVAVARLGGVVAVADVVDGRAREVAAATGGRALTISALLAEPLDVLAPCATGGLLDAASPTWLRARIVCGAANNQLSGPEVAVALHEAGVLYVPDYLANCGGIIQVAGEHLAWAPETVEARLATAEERARALLRQSRLQDTSPLGLVDQLVSAALAGPAHT